MLTSNILAKPPPTGSDFLSAEFVSTDAAELASHMSHCAGSRSTFFPLHAAFQLAHTVLSPRIVTVTAAGVIFVIFIGLLAAT